MTRAGVIVGDPINPKAAETLKCSPVTLKKIMEEKGIGQVYGLVKK